MGQFKTTEFLDQALAAVDIIASGGTGPLHNAKLFLATASFVPSKTSAVGDITQPTTVSFDPPTLTWSTAFRDLDGDIVTQTQAVLVQSADGTPFMVYGVMIVDSGGTNCLMSALLDEPIGLPDALTAFTVASPFGPAAPEEKSPQVVL
jgi:hypothetical protein